MTQCNSEKFAGPNPPHVGVRPQTARDAVLRATTQFLQADRGRVHEYATSTVASPTRLVPQHSKTICFPTNCYRTL